MTPPAGPARIETAEAVAAIVDPIRACGALLGFVVGFAATWRSGGGLTEAALHGLLGAVVLLPVAWFLGLVLVREMIRVNVDEQRRDYEQRLEAARRQVAEQLAATGAVPDRSGVVRRP